MYSIGVRDHIMVAHSLAQESLDPTPRLHGATYTVAVELECEELDPQEHVIDPSLLRDTLREVLAELDHQNLDEHPAFAESAVTVEIIARHLHRELVRRLEWRAGLLTITLEQSPTAFARYRASLRNPSLPPPAEA
jgi:6-pyruvoyl-tetrahydropterin synthase